MALFDALIRELDQRFDLGGQAEVLVAQTVREMTDPGQGGLRGFIERFKDVGLGDLAASWVTKVRAGLPLAVDQLEAALGSGFGAGLSARLGLPAGTLGEALAFAVPRLVDLLAPAGFVQDDLAPEVQSFLAAAPAPPPRAPTSSPGGPVPAPTPTPTPTPAPKPEDPPLPVAGAAALAAPAAPAAPTPGPGARSAPPREDIPARPGAGAATQAASGAAVPASAASAAAAPRAPAAPGPRRGVPAWGWFLACAWTGLLAWWALNPMATAPANQATTPERPAAAADPRAPMPARLFLSNEDGKVVFAGLVGDERTRAAVLDRLRGAFGDANLSGGLELDPRVGAAPWLAVLGGLLGELQVPGADLLLDGNSLKVGGWLSDAERERLLDALRPRCGDAVSFGFLGDKRSEVFTAAAERTRAAIAGLKPGYEGPDLVQALNLWVIHFGPDSAELMADSRELIPPVARAILGAPTALVVEIAGHTDSTGNAAANQALSEARAAAVRDALIGAGVPPARLRARGYGSQRPVASDDTGLGRFRNRRIEFVVVQ